jgi:hypothetical protein
MHWWRRRELNHSGVLTTRKLLIPFFYLFHIYRVCRVRLLSFAQFPINPVEWKPAPALLRPVLSLRVRNRLPLHVVWGIGTAALQRYDVVHHVSGARPRRRSRCWARLQRAECPPRA